MKATEKLVNLQIKMIRNGRLATSKEMTTAITGLKSEM